MRITGLATGMDIDKIVRDSMKPYQIKIDQRIQDKDIVELKQKLYKDVISDVTKFYDKHFDITKSDSLLKSTNYKAITFTSSDENVLKVTSSSSAKLSNYKVTGTKATGSKATVGVEAFTGSGDIREITVNGEKFEVKAGTNDEMAKDLNEQLKNAGMNISVTYTQLAGDGTDNKAAFVFQSTVLGKDTTFTINGTGATKIGTAQGVDATKATVTGFTIDDIKNSGKISIGGKEIDLELTEDDKKDNKLILKKINSKLSDNGFTASEENGNVTFTSTKAGSGVTDPNIEIAGKTGTFTAGIDSEKATVEIDKKNGTYTIGGNVVKIDLTQAESGEQEYLNKLFEENNMKVTAEIVGDKIKLTSKAEGTSGNFNVTTGGTNPSGIQFEDGKDGQIVIEDTKTGGKFVSSGKSNVVTVDGVTFEVVGEIPSTGVSVTGKNDIGETKDKIVDFIKDYNEMIEKLNTITMTRPDKSYKPLTAEQKKEMSETEIKLWNERVEKGQLYKDQDLTRITNALKSSMRTVMESSGLNLEKIGIVPFEDYKGNKNGTFTIDEDKLTKALEEDVEGVMDLFIGKPKEGDTSSPQYTSKTGILYQMKDILYNEVKSSSSLLSKKVGVSGELAKNINDHEKKINDLKKDLAKREQALYSQYARIETMMNKLNAQQSNLMSQLGM